MINKSRLNFAHDISFVLAVFICLLSICLSLYGIVIGKDVYPVNPFVQIRIFSVISFLGAIGAWLGVPYERRGVNNVLFASGIFCILAPIVYFFKGDGIHLFGMAIFFIFFIFGEVFYIECKSFLNGKFALVISYFVLIGAVFLPLLVGGFVNYESSVNPEIIARIEERSGVKNTVVHIDFAVSEYADIHAFIIRSKGDGFYYNPLPVVETLQREKYTLSIPVGPDLALYCYFSEDPKCEDNLGQSSSKTLFKKRKFLVGDNSKIVGADKIRRALISGIDEYLSNNIDHVNSELPLLKVMLTRGVLAHHYSYIYRGLQEGIHAVHNQYGLGPAKIVNAISVVLGLTEFDSIYYSVVLCNLIAVVLICLFFRREVVVVFGTATSILVVFFAFNVIAPYLYFVRYLPILGLIAIIFWGRDEEKRTARFYFLCAFVLFAIGLYNKEYAILVAFSCLFASLIGRDIRYFFASIFVLSPVALFATFVGSENASGANVAALFSGVGIENIFTLPVALWFIFLGFCCTVLFNKTNFVRPRSDVIFLLALIIVLSIKVAWTGSTNHIGPLFAILAIELVYFSRIGIIDLKDGGGASIHPNVFPCCGHFNPWNCASPLSGRS